MRGKGENCKLNNKGRELVDTRGIGRLINKLVITAWQKL